ncbi:MAG: shikimate kinase, partial [Nostocoides sp.]
SGEVAFRSMERDAVASALADQRGVVALGGGAPIDPTTRALLAGHMVVFLDVGIADAARRIGLDASRPLLAISPRASWIAMMKERRPVYDSIASHRVNTAGRTPEDIAAEIAGLLGPTPSVSHPDGRKLTPGPSERDTGS